MCSTLTSDQNVAISNVARREGIVDYILEISPASEKGDGYLGVISVVNIIRERKKLSLILKSAEPSEEVRKIMVVRKAYLREIYMYNKILPEFERFQKERALQNCFTSFVKIYDSSEKDYNEYLILENLREKGYKMWNRKFPMDSQHVASVFYEYGKLHAVSLAMKEKEPEKFEELTKELGDIFKNAFPQETFDTALKATFDKGFKAVRSDVTATAGLKRFYDTAMNFFTEQLHSNEDSLVVNHGDCWCNNMMFKYDDKQNPQKPTKICLLDWQLARIGSPVLDLAYFFFVCSPKDILYDYQRYMKIYHDIASENLRAMSCDPEKIFPFTVLEEHWKKYAKYGLYMALVVLTLMLSDEEEVPVFTEIKSGGNIFDSLNYDCLHINDYNERILDIVVFMTKHELI